MRFFFKPTSYQKGAALAVGATALWKILSFANALLIAACFGAGHATDLYFFLIIIMGVFLYFLQRLNCAVVIPQAMTIEAQTPLAERPLLNGFLYFYGVLALFFILIGVFFPLQTVQLFSRFPADFLAAQRPLITWGLILFGLQILSSYQLSVLEMYKRFAAALLTPLNALLPLLFLAVWGRSCGIISMMYGFVTAHLIQILLFGWAMRKELKWQLTRGELWSCTLFAKNALSNQLIESVVLISGFLPMYLLSGLSAGIVSALNYAKQLSDSAGEIFTSRISNIAKIGLTEHAANHQQNAFNADFLKAHHFLCFLLTPLAVFSIFYAPEIITIFFKRGAFTAMDVRHTAAFLRPLLAILLLLGTGSMQNNVVVAVRKVKEFLPYALSSNLLFIVTLPWAIKTAGAFAYPYVQLFWCVVGVMINVIFLRKFTPWLAIRTSLLDVVRLISLNILALFPCAVYTWYIAGKNPWGLIFVNGVIFVSALAALTYYSGDLQRACRTATSHSITD